MGRSAIFGAVTGAIYKSTRGKRAVVLASVLGAGVGSLYTYMWRRGLLQLKLRM
jgi:hypothetical protein